MAHQIDIPSDDQDREDLAGPCEHCGHFHADPVDGDTHPDRGQPCGDYRCCIN